jgi:hypothetical protein
MHRSIYLATISFTLLAGALSTNSVAADPAARPAAKQKCNLPPSADLQYSVKAKQSGLVIDGNTTMQWSNANKKYSIVTETRAMLVGKILDEKSEGTVDEYGLAPATFTEKRFHKNATTASFNRQAGTISFSDSAQTYPIKGGEQDRVSAMWQLIAVARGAAGKFKPGSSWNFFVAGQRDADPWSFKVVKQEKIATPLGEFAALHIIKMPPPGSKGQQMDIWLAPALEWYPLRLRLTEADGDFIEQTLEKIEKK